jgi:8-oxo-dGTP diphosphatase
MIVSVTPIEYTPSVTTNLEHLEKKSHPPFGVTADIAVFTIRDERFQLLLIERGEIPFLGRLALPGGFLHPDESAEQAAQRELLEETALDADIGHLEQLRTYSTPDRDPRENRVVTVAFWAILPDLGEVRGGTDAARALWVPVDELENDIKVYSGPHGYLAFDHDQIVTDAIERARAKLEYTTVATHFCRPEFTMTQLRRVYETVWGQKLEPANFRRKVEKMNEGFTERTDRTTRDLDAESAPDEPAAERLWQAAHSMSSAAMSKAPSREAVAQPVFHALASTMSSPETHWRLDEFDSADSAPPPVADAPPTSSARRGRPAALYTKGDKDDLEQPFRRPRN